MPYLSRKPATRITIYVVIILVVCIASATSWLLFTQKGLQLILDTTFVKTQLPITYQNLQGSVLTTIQADHVEYQSQSVVVKIEKFKTAFHLLPLLYRKLSFDDVQADQVDVLLLKNNTEKSPNNDSKNHDTGMTVAIGIGSANIHQLNITPHQQEPIRTTDIKIDNAIIQNRFEFERLIFKSQYANVDAEGLLGFGAKASFKLAVNWDTTAIDSFKDFKGMSEIDGSYNDFHMTTQIASPTEVQMQAHITNLFDSLTWDAKFEGKELPASILWPGNSIKLDQFILVSKGNVKQYSLDVNARLVDVNYGDWQLGMNGNFDDDAWIFKSFKLKSLQTAAEMDLNGKISPLKNSSISDYPAEFNVSLNQLQWPVAGDGLVKNLTGNAKITGTYNDYKFESSIQTLELRGQDITELAVNGTGNPHLITLPKVNFHYLEGIWDGQLSFDWANRFQSKADIQINGIDPSLITDTKPGKLSAKISLSANYERDLWHVSGKLHKLAGQLMDIKVDSCTTQFELQPDKYSFKRLRLASGKNVVNGNFNFEKSTGKDDYKVNSDWQVNLKDISRLTSNASGNLKSEGRLSGTLSVPVVAMKLTAGDLNFNGIKVGTFATNITADMNRSGKLELQTKVKNLQVKDVKIQTIDLNVNGKSIQHHVTLLSEFDSVNNKLMLEADGGYDNGLWKGQLTSILASFPASGSWKLLKPVNIQTSSTSISLQELCMAETNHDSRVCSQVNVTFPDTWSGHLTIQKFPIGMLSPASSGPVQLTEGNLDGDVNFDIDNGEIKQLKGKLNSETGQFSYRLPVDGQKKQDYKDFEVSVIHDSRGINFSNNISLVNTGETKLQLSLPGMDNIKTYNQSQPVNGELHMDLNNLNILSLVFPDLEHINGKKTTNFKIQGTVANPIIVGSTQFSAESASVPAIGLKLANIRLKAVSNPQRRLDVQGEMSSGKGKLEMQGNLQDYQAEKLQAKLSIKGNDFTAANTPELSLDVSPDLKLKLNDKLITMDGTITVPKAQLRVLNTSSSLQSSSDLVIVDSEQPTSSLLDLKLKTAIRVKLGDHVRIQSDELKGRLEGEVLVQEESNGLSIASGEIRIVDGKYFFGLRDLEIKTGKIIYSSVPITQPSVDIEAVKQINDVITVGIRITGLATATEPKLFSTPPMNNADILSYIIYGHPIESSNKQQGSALMAAAVSLGLNRGGETIIKDLSKLFGIDEITVETNEATQQTSMALGKYFSPDLYAKYIFGAVNTLQLEYKLTKQWIFRTEASGVTQGADLLYQIETK